MTHDNWTAVDYMNSSDPNDFLQPPIHIIDQYHVRSFNTNFNDGRTKKKSNLPTYTDNDDLLVCEEQEDDYEIKMTKTGKFLIEFKVAPPIFPSLIGTKGEKLKQLETDTRAHIKVPKQGSNVVITGETERDVVAAIRRINLISLEVREKHPITHFLSIPVCSAIIKSNFETFKSNILSGPLIRGIDPYIFQKPEKFHLTIVTLVLLDNVEVDAAKQALRDCKKEIVDLNFEHAGPLRLKLEGVEIMNDDPNNVDILYGKVQVATPKYNTSFQRMADQLLDYFVRKGFAKQEFDHVKLHVTLMNSLFRKSKAPQGSASSSQDRESFDAEPILKKYKNFVFGEADLEFIHLSVRFTTSETSYYEALTTIKFN